MSKKRLESHTLADPRTREPSGFVRARLPICLYTEQTRAEIDMHILKLPLRKIGFPSSSLAALSIAAVAAFACDVGESSEAASTGGFSATTGGTASAGGVQNSGGSTNTGGSPGPSNFGTPTQSGSGTSSDRWAKSAVKRNDVNYFFMANGWGPGFTSQSVSWLGTSFTVASMQGKQGAGYEPASYPTLFCGVYSDSASGECGLPKALTAITSLKTGWRWKPNGNNGQYNASYDIWLSNSASVSGHTAFLMVWLRDPPGQQPAGSLRMSNLQVSNVPGDWNLWVGSVSGKPYVAYVRAEGRDSYELEFDVMDFVRDASSRSVSLPGSQILSVAVGFEIWNGPITNLVSEDFYVEAR
jgi:hypothetical protein